MGEEESRMMEQFSVFFNQVNQTRYNVQAKTREDAIRQAMKLWREENGQPRGVHVEGPPAPLPKPPKDPPICDEDGAEMEFYGNAGDTGNDGYRCPKCGWSFDIETVA